MPAIIDAPFGSPEFALCMDIRIAVFVDEQRVPLDEERDALDAAARHFLVLEKTQPAGTARVIFKERGIAKITRVAVLAAFRGQGLGAALMRHIALAVPARQFVLDAQLHALKFYEALGYAAEGEVFMEAGIAHRRMVKPGITVA